MDDIGHTLNVVAKKTKAFEEFAGVIDNPQELFSTIVDILERGGQAGQCVVISDDLELPRCRFQKSLGNQVLDELARRIVGQ